MKVKDVIKMLELYNQDIDVNLIEWGSDDNNTIHDLYEVEFKSMSDHKGNRIIIERLKIKEN